MTSGFDVRYVAKGRFVSPFQGFRWIIDTQPRAALCGYRRGALPWAGLWWPFRPAGWDAQISPQRGSHKSAQGRA